MTKDGIYRIFKNYFPNFVWDRTATWYPNGRDSIRVKNAAGEELIFTYSSEKNWRLETIDSFLEKMKGETK